MKLRSVHIDCVILAVGSFCGGMAAGFAPDSAYQYVDKHVVFWMRVIMGSISITCINLISFRNNSYGKDAAKQLSLTDNPLVPTTKQNEKAPVSATVPTPLG